MPHIPPALVPTAPLHVRLHVLRYTALPPTSKLSFLAATLAASRHFATTFPVLLHVLAAHSCSLLPLLLFALLPITYFIESIITEK
ncbi:hypothetical protein ZWY2020_053680 [Hordeum vulgare]|nr:hypothetical protein ZWY2020_053680 [Hordeum vulgare]